MTNPELSPRDDREIPTVDQFCELFVGAEDLFRKRYVNHVAVTVSKTVDGRILCTEVNIDGNVVKQESFVFTDNDHETIKWVRFNRDDGLISRPNEYQSMLARQSFMAASALEF